MNTATPAAATAANLLLDDLTSSGINFREMTPRSGVRCVRFNTTHGGQTAIAFAQELAQMGLRVRISESIWYSEDPRDVDYVPYEERYTYVRWGVGVRKPNVPRRSFLSRR